MSLGMKAWRSLQSAEIWVLMAVSAAAQSPSPLLVQSFPTGLRPLGVDFGYAFGPPGTPTRVFAATANSGEDSVSIFELASQNSVAVLQPVTIVRGIPTPVGLSFCEYDQEGVPTTRLLVASPSDNSVAVVRVPEGTVLGKINVGSQPNSVVCLGGGPITKGAVSNFGDNSLAVINVDSLTVIGTTPNVPGSRNWRGVGITSVAGTVAWVAGSDADVLTAVDLATSRVLATLPVRGPTAVRESAVASASDNAIITFDPRTLQQPITRANIPNPQDFYFPSGLGNFATSGKLNSVWRADSGGTVSTIPGIPGAAGLAAFSFNGGIVPNTGVVLVTSPDSNSAFLIQAQPNLPSNFRVSNGASFTTSQVSPGSLVSAFAATGVSQNFNANALPLPGTLGGVALSVGGTLNFDVGSSKWIYSSTGSIQAPLLFVGSTQVNFQIPPGIAVGSSVAAQLTKPDGTTLLTTLSVTATGPGIFTVLQNGQGQAAALNPDYSQNGNPQSIVGAKPATRGSFIQIFATGSGDTTPPLMPGQPAPASGNPLVTTNIQPTVTIGGQTAQVLFSGMAPGFVGLWQINAQIPDNVTPGPAVPLVITAGGSSSNTVTIAIQ